jgi:DNA-binding MarR family transcriptional regulator
VATAEQLAYADRAGSFYAREYGFPPVTGRVLGYLAVCDPAQPTIGDLAEALRASRSAITAAVKQLEGLHAVRRARVAGDRFDRVSLNPDAGLESRGFDATAYKLQAELAREGLALAGHADPERRAVLQEAAALYDFLAARLPEVLAEWQQRRAAMHDAGDAQLATAKEKK